MRAIGVQYVSIVAHSCGVIYALNTIYSMPWILPPSNRKLYLLAPWVPPVYSGVTLLSISSLIPSALFHGFDSIVRFANSTIIPVVQFSGGILGAASAPFSKPCPGGPMNSEARFQKHERDDLCHEYCGLSAAGVAARSKVLMQRVLGESIRGSNHEALLCLQKEIAGSWGPCDDYESYADLLETKLHDYYLDGERAEGVLTGASPSTVASNRLAAQRRCVLKVFWAERDKMIGKKGEEYFNKCFQRLDPDGPSSNGEHDRCLSYESERVLDTDHDTLCLPQYGALSKILEDLGGNRDYSQLREVRQTEQQHGSDKNVTMSEHQPSSTTTMSP